GRPPENWYSHRSKPGAVPGGGPSRPPYCGEGVNLWGMTGATRQSGDGGSTPPISTMRAPATHHTHSEHRGPPPRGARNPAPPPPGGAITNPTRKERQCATHTQASGVRPRVPR